MGSLSPDNLNRYRALSPFIENSVTDSRRIGGPISVRFGNSTEWALYVPVALRSQADLSQCVHFERGHWDLFDENRLYDTHIMICTPIGAINGSWGGETQSTGI